ncbi:carboxypeptidase-like regulatory domain-containing protein, partial [uncultured Muribaculum sp.]
MSFTLSSYAQQSIHGNVVDSQSGEPLPGVTVMVKGMSIGTSTDIDGRFSITLPPPIEGKQLQVSYIGYVPQTITLKSTEELTIKMIEDSQNLDEVVVIGYGTQRKGDVTSSVASVKSENFVKGAVKDVGQLIQGKVAGLAITNPSGDPTGNTQIRLRGTSTIGGANTAPLILIDGIPGDFNTVAPEDVE